MHIVHVHVHVKPDCIEAFRASTLDNAHNSTQEPGVLRFDVLHQADDSTRFLLIEIYKTADDQLRHRETAHYLRWRGAVAEMMAEPRQAILFNQNSLQTNSPSGLRDTQHPNLFGCANDAKQAGCGVPGNAPD